MKLIASKENLDSTIRAFLLLAKKNIECDGHVAPIAFILDAEKQPDGELIPGGHGMCILGFASMTDNAEKDMIAETIRTLIQATNASGYCFLSECWYTHEKANDASIVSIMPSQSPDRREGVMAIVEHREFGVATYMVPIIRENGSVTLGDATVKISGEDGYELISGRFFGLLTAKKPITEA